MKGLTARQAEILRFIQSATETLGRPPTFREIGTELKIASTNGVWCHIEALRAKGCFEKPKKTTSLYRRVVFRDLTLTDKARALLQVRVPNTHKLKLCSTVFPDVESRAKRCEVRVHDRDFQVGDFLDLHEWDAEAEVYTGRQVKRVITHIVEGGQWGLPATLCVLSIAPVGGRR